MDKLIININNYKSINKANIEINKLNVVSGVNGSGKSTVGRMFYSFLKGNSTKRRDYFFNRISKEFNDIIDTFDQQFLDYNLPDYFEITDTDEEIIEKYNSLQKITEKHKRSRKLKIEELNKQLSEEFEFFLKKLEKEGYININEIEFSKNDIHHRIYVDLCNLIPNFKEIFDEDIKKISNLYSERLFYIITDDTHIKFESTARLLKKYVGNDSFEVSEESMQSILIKEQTGSIDNETLNFEIELANNSKTNAYEYFFNHGFIDNIYYFDNVSIFDLYLLNSKRHIVLSHNDEFMEELFNGDSPKTTYDYSSDYYENYDDSTKSILEKIETIIGGIYTCTFLPLFSTGKTDNSLSEDSTQGREVYTLSNTPSGIKQMGIIQVLLLNNKLKKGDYLIIDEPEVNLHPDWQFKFAEILVLLAKLDITIYINTHSPLLIESISAFSEFYDMQDDVNYYLTEPSDAEGKYDFVKISSDEIFRVYDNLGNAYDLIDQLRLKKRFGE